MKLFLWSQAGEPICFRHAVLFAVNYDEDAQITHHSDVAAISCATCHRQFPGHDKCVWRQAVTSDQWITNNYVECGPEIGSYVSKDLVFKETLSFTNFVRKKEES